MMLLNSVSFLFFRWGYGILLLIACSALQRFTSRSAQLPNLLLPAFYDSAASELQFRREQFDWNDLDLTQRASCGMTKCFFASARDGGGEEGYLIQHSKRNQTKTYEKWQRIWERAEELTSSHNGTRHFLLDPPLMPVDPPLEVLKKLNAMVFGPGRTNNHYFGKTKRYRATPNVGFIVQRVKAAPTPSLISRCYFFGGEKKKKGEEGRFKFDDLSASTDKFRLAVSDENAFMSTFETELRRTIKLLADERFSSLWKDFQFLLDNQGRIHHIDLDRMEERTFRYPSKKGAKQCFDGALSKLASVLNGNYTFSGVEKLEKKA